MREIWTVRQQLSPINPFRTRLFSTLRQESKTAAANFCKLVCQIVNFFLRELIFGSRASLWSADSKNRKETGLKLVIFFEKNEVESQKNGPDLGCATAHYFHKLVC